MKYSLLALGILATTFGLASCLPIGLPELPELPEVPEVEVPAVEVPEVKIPVLPYQ